MHNFNSFKFILLFSF